MHLKKCALFLSFCTVFTPKRQGSPPFERKRRDGEKGNFPLAFMRFPRCARAHFFLRDFTSAVTDAFFLQRDFSRSGKGACFPPNFHIDSHRRVFLLQRDFSRSGKGRVFPRDFTSTVTDAFFFCIAIFHDRVKVVWFFRAFTSTVTDAFFFCDGTIHDRAREEHLRVKPHTGADTRFFRCGSFVGRREERRRFHSPIGAKKIPISPAKRRQPLDNRLLFCYTV